MLLSQKVMILDSVDLCDMTTKFDSLNDEFNVVDDIVQPEVIERKIEKNKKRK